MVHNNAINSLNPFVQLVSSSVGTLVTCSTSVPYDDTIPQQTEGDQVLTVSITPKFSTSNLEIFFNTFVSFNSSGGTLICALFQDSTADALSAKAFSMFGSSSTCCSLRHIMTSGTTSSTTFKIRIGPSTGNAYVNGDEAGNQYFGGTASTTLIVKEYL